MGTELQTAKEKVTLYQAKKDNTLSPAQDETLSEDSWLDIVDKQVTEAIEQGAFDNLAGEGKPLDFSQDSLVPDDKRLAYKLLKNNDLTPAWIGKRSDLDSEVKKWRADLITQFERAQCEWQTTNHVDERTRVQNRWTNCLALQREKLEALNREIRATNLQQPIASLEIFYLRIDEELEKLGISVSLDSL